MAFPDRDLERNLLAMFVGIYPRSFTEEQVQEETAKKFKDVQWSDIKKELSYLRDKKLIEIDVRKDQHFNIIGTRYTITAKGIDVSSGTKL